MTTLPLLAAAGYSLIYLLGGGGLFGAFVVFIVMKMFRKQGPRFLDEQRQVIHKEGAGRWTATGRDR